jgi:hypothetical protein
MSSFSCICIIKIYFASFVFRLRSHIASFFHKIVVLLSFGEDIICSFLFFIKDISLWKFEFIKYQSFLRLLLFCQKDREEKEGK